MTQDKLKAPFPWFGGKSRAADLIWSRLGDVPNYVEPFAGSLAVLLARPHAPRLEAVNDLDCFVANFWRALRYAPEAVADCADEPVHEADLIARNAWLMDRTEFQQRMKADPMFFDVRIAGWWVWALSSWIGSGCCSTRPMKKLPKMGGPQGVNRCLPGLLSATAATALERRIALLNYMTALHSRLRHVKVASGDWSRLLTPAVTTGNGLTGVLLDPPYLSGNMEYAAGRPGVAHDVRRWAIEHGDDPMFRIALCGYAGEHEHEIPSTWTCVPWKAHKGYQKVKADGTHSGHNERIWFSPHCLTASAELLVA